MVNPDAAQKFLKQGLTYDDVLLKFERELIEEWKQTRERVEKAGLSDEDVTFDLFLSAHPDLHAEYAAYRASVHRTVFLYFSALNKTGKRFC